MSRFTTIILAAGKGTRMGTTLPKVVHPVAGRPMIERSLRVFLALRDGAIRAGEVRVVVGVGEALVRAIAEPMGAICFKQEAQRGTADAVKSAKPEDLSGDVLILNGDHPLLEPSDIERFIREFREFRADLAVVTAEVTDPQRLGRVVRDGGRVRAIVEAKDASHETLKIREINTGIYVIKANVLNSLLPEIKSSNAQGEFYLTDLIAGAVEGELRVNAIAANERVAFGVNSQRELAEATTRAFAAKAGRLLEGGVILMQPASVFIEDSVEVGSGSTIFPNVYLRGKTRIGAHVVIEPGCVLTDAVVGDACHLRAGCYLSEATVEKDCTLGPYAHLRPGTEIGAGAHVGNFVEMKKTKFGAGAKAGHLTYLGDAEIGENTNIGCGTITCNYGADRKKHKTKIGRDVFVGSDTQFVAPVEIGDGATIGAGSTITRDVPAGSLALSRSEQTLRENFRRPDPTPKKD